MDATLVNVGGRDRSLRITVGQCLRIQRELGYSILSAQFPTPEIALQTAALLLIPEANRREKFIDDLNAEEADAVINGVYEAIIQSLPKKKQELARQQLAKQQATLARATADPLRALVELLNLQRPAGNSISIAAPSSDLTGSNTRSGN